MHVPASVAEAAGWIAYHFDQLQPYLPTYAHLLVAAVAPIYAGSHASLSRPSSAAAPAKKDDGTGADEDEDEDEESVQRMEGLSTSDALLFPIMAGVTLTSLYFIIRWLEDPAILNKILNWYFAGFSVFSVCRLVSDGLDTIHSLAFPHDYLDGGRLFHVNTKKRLAISQDGKEHVARTSPLPGPFSRLPLPGLAKDICWFLRIVPNRKLSFKGFVRGLLDAEVKLGVHGLEGIVIGLLSVLYYNFVGKPWFLTNLFGFGFAYGALQLLSPTTFTTGSLLLSLLFCYDIYFVFYTPMMVGVAKSLDVPVKLLFPAPPRPEDPTAPSLSMLGLGDIVLPGIMIGLALRFDLYLFYLRKQTQQPQSTSDKATAPTEIVKAPYRTVGEGWGDRMWTSPLVNRFFAPMSSSSEPGYRARNSFPKTYFTASMVGYVMGMLTTLGAMQLSNHPQPALLYLVPGVLGSLWLTALARGELHLLYEFSDAGDLEDDAKKHEPGAKDPKAGNDQQQDKKPRPNERAAGNSKSERSIIDKLSDRVEKHLDASDKQDKSKETSAKESRILFSFAISLPELSQSSGARNPAESRWTETSAQSSSLKSDDGHADKRIRTE